MTWDEKFLGLLPHIAEWSEDESSKHSAIIVDKRNRIIATGYNGFPRGVKHEAERQVRPAKYEWFAHAEQNAMDNATCDLEGGVLYCDFFPCAGCARSIIQKGIRRVCVPEGGLESELVHRWADSQGVARQMFRESGVEF